MTEKQLLARYYEAYADWDNLPTDYNARLVFRFANALAGISDDYDDLLDQARDIIGGLV